MKVNVTRSAGDVDIKFLYLFLFKNQFLSNLILFYVIF